MGRQFTFATVLWVLAVALLPIRMADAHLHFCLDGQERPVALHVQDVATHSAGEHHSDDGHNDRDVDVSASLLTTKVSSGTDDAPLALLHVYLLAILLPLQDSLLPSTDITRVEFDSVLTFLPPVRGPPPAIQHV